MATENQLSHMDERWLVEMQLGNYEKYVCVCVHKESYPATKFCILTPADSGVPKQTLGLVAKVM